MNDYSKGTKATLSFVETLKIYEFLQQETVLKMVDPVLKTYQYQSNWTDRTVANHFSMIFHKKVTQNNVGGLRLREFGPLSVAAEKTQPVDTLRDEVTTLRDEVATLREQLRDFNERHTHLAAEFKEMSIELAKVKLKIKLG